MSLNPVHIGLILQKMLAKMACSVNKPNKQTVLLSSDVSDFLASMSVRKVGRYPCLKIIAILMDQTFKSDP